MKYLIFGAGIGLLGFWLFLWRNEILANVRDILSHPVSIFLGVFLIIVVGLIVVTWHTKLGKNPAIV